MEEPSVLDYLKSKLAPWKYSQIELNKPTSEAEPLRQNWPWRSLLGLFLAIIAQRSLEPGANRSLTYGLIWFFLAAFFILWAAWRGEWKPAEIPQRAFENDAFSVRGIWLFAGLGFALLAFMTFAGDEFNFLNTSLLLLAIIFLVTAFWKQNEASEQNRLDRLKEWITKHVQARDLLWAGLVIAVLAVAAYYRFAQLSQVPGEMNSDHAEKILDVLRLLYGQTNVFFSNNGGREALEFYLIAGAVKFFGANLSFMTMKWITTGIGFLSLPFIYLIGKEIASPRVGLLAMAFAGIAYWPNVVSRLGLRLPFYILFTAIVLLLLLRGLRSGRRNDYIWLGLALGLSMYGYSADRILPLLIFVALGLYCLHIQIPEARRQAFWFTVMTMLVAFVLILPMLHYIIDQPSSFFYRTLTRLGGMEQPLAGPAILIFLKNTGRALAMFSWSDGEVWTTSVPYRPALEVASGALFWSGVLITFVAYIRKRQWERLFLLISIPVLMFPSIMALAFPNENPNLYRTGGAMIPVFILIAWSLDGLMTSLIRRFSVWGARVAWGLAALLLLFSAFQSYNLVFDQYRSEYERASWNTSEIGQIVKGFVGTYGQVDNVWIMGYPYWIDTRLVGIIAGYPLHDFAFFGEDVNQLPDNKEAKLFIINPADQIAVNALQKRYTQGILTTYPTTDPAKAFLLFFIPPQKG